MEFRLVKMVVEQANPIRYFFSTAADHLFLLNDLLGKKISIIFKHKITCLNCDTSIKKTYSGGYCYKCFMSLAQTDTCIVSPYLCHYHLGTCREPLWGEEHCMQPHIVYLANTSGPKVGVTRMTQIPTRWIDQGAHTAMPIIKTKNRREAGIIEKLFASAIDDKTNWRNMLKGVPEPVNYLNLKKQLFFACGQGLDELEESFGSSDIELLEDQQIYEFQYPILSYPDKVSSFNLDKLNLVEGTLIGIKGQYLILDTGVINIRNHGGYHIEFKEQ